MAQDFAKSFYDSKAWQSCRDSFIANRIAIDGGKCEECHKALGYIVHHKIELTPQNIGDAYISLNHINLEYVCHECHNKLHDVWQNKRDYTFDDDGNFVPLPKNFSNPP